MKKFLLLFTISIILFSCDQSEGSKFGTLQKVSHKTFPCDYYEIQVAYEGGTAVSNSDGRSSFSNSQDIKIDKAAFDSLSQFIGDKIVFSYKDNGIAMCGESKVLTELRIKK